MNTPTDIKFDRSHVAFDLERREGGSVRMEIPSRDIIRVVADLKSLQPGNPSIPLLERYRAWLAGEISDAQMVEPVASASSRPDSPDAAPPL